MSGSRSADCHIQDDGALPMIPQNDVKIYSYQNTGIMILKKIVGDIYFNSELNMGCFV